MSHWPRDSVVARVAGFQPRARIGKLEIVVEPARKAWLILRVAVCLTAIGCTQTRSHRADGMAQAQGIARGATVVLVQPDIEVSELLANGVQELRADWTTSAKALVEAELAAALEQRSAKVQGYAPASDAALLAAQRQIILLHRAVGVSILLHQFAGMPLPHKMGAFDWSLGPGARVIDPDARYALFVTVRDSYATSGRKALMAGLMLVGVGLSLGEQFGFASLVDLNDGRVVWFNVLTAQRGDLRNPTDAKAAVSELLEGAPL